MFLAAAETFDFEFLKHSIDDENNVNAVRHEVSYNLSES